MSEATTPLERIGQIAMVVHDIAKAEDFYKRKLGLKHLFSAPPRLAFFEIGGVRLMLGLPEPGLDYRSAILYFEVADIHAAHRDLVARGVAFGGEPHVVGKLGDKDVWLAEFKDPDGNLLALQSVAPHRSEER